MLISNAKRLQAEQQLAAELTLQPNKVRPVPPAPSAEVRLNAAAILREDALYKKKQREEAEMIKRCPAAIWQGAPYPRLSLPGVNGHAGCSQRVHHLLQMRTFLHVYLCSVSEASCCSVWRQHHLQGLYLLPGSAAPSCVSSPHCCWAW